jgi:hypothetical protein
VAVPRIIGALAFAGDGGSVAVRMGAGGGLESSTYVTELGEQLEALPAASVAVAWKLVVASSATATGAPAVLNVLAITAPSGWPLQAALSNTFTLEPASALPLTRGLLLLAGEAGAAETTVGGSGGVESST